MRTYFWMASSGGSVAGLVSIEIFEQHHRRIKLKSKLDCLDKRRPTKKYLKMFVQAKYEILRIYLIHTLRIFQYKNEPGSI